jgi:hypothetical protein
MKTPSHLFEYGSDPRFSFNFSTEQGINRLSECLIDAVSDLRKRVDFLSYFFEEIKKQESKLVNDMNNHNSSKDSNFSTSNNDKIVNDLIHHFVFDVKYSLQLLEMETYFTVNSNKYDETSPTKHWTNYHTEKKSNFISFDLYQDLTKSIMNLNSKLPKKTYKEQKSKIDDIMENMDVIIGPVQDKIKTLQLKIPEYIRDEGKRLSDLSLSKKK